MMEDHEEDKNSIKSSHHVVGPHMLNSRVKTLRQANEVQTGPVVAVGYLRRYSSDSIQSRQLTG